VLDFSRNHFDLFGLPRTFDVDLERLAQRYRDLQQALHPDRFASAGDREKRLSLQASTQVNEAYRTLRDPLARARYMLFLETGEIVSENGATEDMEFLMEQMDLRETLGEAKNQSDPHATIEQVMDRLEATAEKLFGALARCLDSSDADQRDQARELVRKLQFVEKCRIEAERVETDLDELL